VQRFGFQWHITDNCDQRCEHCYIYNGKGVVPVSQGLILADNLQILDKMEHFCNTMECTLGITVTGGDPLLYPEVHGLFSEFHERGITFAILGNPFHLDGEVVDWLRKMGCVSYQMSIDGMEKTHDLIRKQGSFQATVDAYKLLQDHGIKTSVMTTISALNASELVDVVRLSTAIGVDVFGFARYCPTHEDVEAMLTPLEYRAVLSDVWSVFEDLADKGTTFALKDHLWNLFLQEEGYINLLPTDVMVDGCHCGVSHMTVLSDGTIYGCRRFDSPIGNALNSNFEELFFSEKMEEYRNIDKIVGCSECELLNYCRGCRAVAVGSSGNYFAKDPQCWK
jgi:radical SAM/SPASM domain protein of ACGX system